MGSISMSPNKIPAISFTVEDFAPESSSSWCSLQTEVRRALATYGCFEAVFGDIQLLHDEMLHAMEQLFDLPLETRLRHPANDRYRGRQNPTVPLWGNVGITGALDPGTLENFTNLMWPQGNARFRETIESYIRQGSRVEKMVRKMVFESYGVERYCDSLAEATTYWVRLNKYSVPKPNETNLGLFEHTDTSFLTVLTQNDVNGLEIQARNGDWIKVTPSPSSYIVLVGDPLMAWSNGRLHSPLHRVMMNVDRVRYSVAVFAYIKGTMIQTPEELVDDEHPLLFKPFDHFEYRSFLSTADGQKAKSAIKAYAGV